MEEMKAKRFWGILAAVVCVGCTKDHGYGEYQRIKNSSVTGAALLDTLTEFEIRNADNFEAKVDLGTYYLLTQDYRAADLYLSRAESVVGNARRGKDRTKMLASLYGSLASLRMLDGDYDKALAHATTAMRAGKKDGARFAYLKARILALRQDRTGALALFDRAYTVDKIEMNPDERRVYMELLADAGRYGEANLLVAGHFLQGGYFPGFGLFASTVSERIGNREDAVLYAFLDYEFRRDEIASDDSAFLKRLDDLEGKLRSSAGDGSSALAAVNAIRSRFDKTIPYAVLSEKTGFVYEYIYLRNLIRDSGLSPADFNRYLALEGVFRRFPSYYWGVWESVANLPRASRTRYVPALEKIIALDPEGVYAGRARRAIGSGLGLTGADSMKLLMPVEVERDIASYLETGDESGFRKVLDLFGLPDNAYVFSALAIVERKVGDARMKNLLARSCAGSLPRVKERVDYLLAD
jgi:hypothetical protein